MVIKPRHIVDIPDQDILSFLFDNPQYDPSLPLFIDAQDLSHRFKLGDVRKRVKQIGKGLKVVGGVNPGDVVMMFSPNSLLFPCLQLGTICADAIWSAANYNYGAEELAHQIRDSGASVLFVAESKLSIAKEAARLSGFPMDKIWVASEADIPGVRTSAEFLIHGEREWTRITDSEVLAKTTITLNYSSGTTGLPKGCMLTHRNFLANCINCLHIQNYGEDIIRKNGEHVPRRSVASFLPFYHALGQQEFIINAIRGGFQTYVMATFDFPQLLSLIQNERLNSLWMVPPVAVKLGKDPIVQKFDLSSVRFPWCGAAPLGLEGQRRVEKVFDPTGSRNIFCRQGYGMTELTCMGILFDPSEHDPVGIGVGHLMPNSYAKLVDEEGREVQPGEPGELCLKGPNVFLGYWKNTQASKDAFDRDGWFITGDVAIVDHKGMFSIVDRRKELIKVKAFQVAPAELEDLLIKHDSISDAAVIGITSEGTELPRAYVVRTTPDLTEDQVKEFVRQHLAHYKQLTGGVEFVDIIPKSPSGKIYRRQLRDRYASKNKL